MLLKDIVKKLDRKSFVYLKTFVAHLGRICGTNISKELQENRAFSLANLFSTLIFREVMLETANEDKVSFDHKIQIEEIELVETANTTEIEAKKSLYIPKYGESYLGDSVKMANSDEEINESHILPPSPPEKSVVFRVSSSTLGNQSLTKLQPIRVVIPSVTFQFDTPLKKRLPKSKAFGKLKKGSSFIVTKKLDTLDTMKKIKATKGNLLELPEFVKMIARRTEKQSELEGIFEWDSITRKDLEIHLMQQSSLTPFGTALQVLILNWKTVFGGLSRPKTNVECSESAFIM